MNTTAGVLQQLLKFQSSAMVLDQKKHAEATSEQSGQLTAWLFNAVG
jgi:hypothetical protein